MICDAINKLLSERIGAGDFPSAVYLVAENGEIVLHGALGFAVVDPNRIAATKETIYDLASLTKPLVTGLLAALAIEGSRIGLDTKISNLTVSRLATHTSGLPAWRPLYLQADPAENVETLIRSLKTSETPAVEYSDLGFILLAKAVRCDGLDVEFQRSVAGRLRLKRTMFNPLANGFTRLEVAASEEGSGYERQMCAGSGDFAMVDASGSDPFRDDVIWGEVHDGNAYFLGGIAGHAGLFSTAEEVFRIALQCLPDHSQVLNRESCCLFHTNFTPGMSEDRSFAFQLASTKDSTAGTRMSPESFGHNGFTGTSLWIDPIKDRIFVLLTNRTHNHGLPFANINAVRRRFHDLAIECLDSK